MKPSSPRVRPADALANERTFLAYARTALAFIGFGFVVARFALFEREVGAVAHLKQTSPQISMVFGTVMALAGVGCAMYGAYRYVRAVNAIRLGADASMPDGASVVIAGAITIIGLIVTWVLFAYR
jgi:putative membrane protein